MKAVMIRINVFTLLAVTLFFSFQYHSQLQAATPGKPNIVIIYADDLGYGDVSCYNPDRGKISTPHIDQLAAEGMRFTDAHSSSGVCSPSRYTLLTGRYHWRTHLQKGIVGLWGKPLIAPDRLTIGSIAQKAGYKTACIGKWHRGWDWPISKENRPYCGRFKKDAILTKEHHTAWRETFSQMIGGGPTTRGFDNYFGTDVPNHPPFCFIENNRTIGIPSQFLPQSKLVKNQASVQGPAVKGWALEPILPALSERTAQFIRREANTPEPFLIYMPLTSPHTPLSVNEEWKGKSNLNLYGDFVMETDAVVGQVLAAIQESGATENTLVLFTSDNGCAHYIGTKEMEGKGHFASGPLRGYKSDAWEGGHRVPFIVRWPGMVKQGSTNKNLIHQADVMATLAEIIGQTLPDNAGEDSFSFLSQLKGANQPVRPHAISCSIRGVPSLRDGDWKYIPDTGSGGWTRGRGDFPVQLYNLTDDIGETNNLAKQYPERVTAMQILLENLITKGRSTPGKKQKNDVKVVRFGRK